MFRNPPKICKVMFTIYAVSFCYLTNQLLMPAETKNNSFDNSTFPLEEDNSFMPISPEYNSTAETFDLENKIPLSKDARQIFNQNPVMVYVGIYDANTRVKSK